MSKVFLGAFGLKEVRVEKSYTNDKGAAWLAIGPKGSTRESGAGGGMGVHLDRATTLRLYHELGEILAS